MMTRILVKATVASVVALIATQASAQTSAQLTDTTGTTTIIAPISLIRNSNLVFGTVTRPTGANSSLVKITAGGTFSITGGDAVAAGGTPTAASYTVNGESGSGYSISLGALTMARSGGGSIPVTLTSSKNTGTLTGGTDTFAVGGEFTLTNATLLGAYSGTFNVTVQYN
jgi:hypothetical protein